MEQFLQYSLVSLMATWHAIVPTADYSETQMVQKMSHQKAHFCDSLLSPKKRALLSNSALSLHFFPTRSPWRPAPTLPLIGSDLDIFFSP